MKPKSPNKDKRTPKAKKGKVREEAISYPEWLIGDYRANQPKMIMIVKSNIWAFALYDDGSNKRIE